MANDYTTVTEVKAVMPDTSWSTSYDGLLTTLITRASRSIDLFTGREPGSYSVSTNTTRYFNGSGLREQWIDEIAEVSTVAVAETGVVDGANGSGGTYTTWATSDYFLWPYNASQFNRPYQRLDLDQLNGSKQVWYHFPKAIKITGKWGYATTTNLPPEIVQTTIIQTARWFKRGQQAFQDTGAIVELGQLRYTKALDPDVAEMIMHLRKVAI